MSSFFVILAGVLWGTISLFVNGLKIQGFNVVQIMMLRSFVASAVLFVLLFFKKPSLLKIRIKDIWMFICTGIISLAFFSFCYFNTIVNCGAGIAVVLLYTSPVFVIILSFLFFREKFNLFKIIAVFLTVTGLYLIAGDSQDGESAISLKGLFIGLCSGFGYALYSIFCRIALKKYNTLTINFYTFVFCFAACLGLSGFDIVTEGELNSARNIFMILGAGIICTVLPYYFYTKGLEKLENGKAAVIATIEPLVGTLTGIFIFSEDISLLKLAGMILIFGAVCMCAINPVKLFLSRHNFKSVMIVDEILKDMHNPDSKSRGQDMFRTWMIPPASNPKNEKVIVIDAGGTNFRSCLVTFDGDGKPFISDFKKCGMPAIDREYTKDEFFAAIADRIDYLKNKSDKIGFCFSYAMNITKDHDGIPNAFSKEIKAREVLGVPVGRNLVEELSKRGWNKISKITLLNDTVGALLAGSSRGGNYSSYIGFILGTGMNGAFVDENNGFGDGRQIIVCENGKCNTIELSDFDKLADSKTDIPGQYPLEKCCSGAYLGKTALEVVLMAAKEKLFSDKTCEELSKLKELTTIELNSFLLGEDCSLKNMCFADHDHEIMRQLLDACVDRTARYASSILAANLINSGAGKDPSKPVCIVLNGTTLYKTYRLKERMEQYLYEYASVKKGIYYQTVCVEDDITIGTAVAALC